LKNNTKDGEKKENFLQNKVLLQDLKDIVFWVVVSFVAVFLAFFLKNFFF